MDLGVGIVPTTPAIPQQSDTVLVRPRKEAVARKAAKTKGFPLELDDEEPLAVDVDNAHIVDR